MDPDPKCAKFRIRIRIQYIWIHLVEVTLICPGVLTACPSHSPGTCCPPESHVVGSCYYTKTTFRLILKALRKGKFTDHQQHVITSNPLRKKPH